MNLYAELELEKALAKASPRRARIILFAKVADELVIRYNPVSSETTGANSAGKLGTLNGCAGRKRAMKLRLS